MSYENPESRWFVVLDSNENCIAKFDTNDEVYINTDDYSIEELSAQSELDNYDYNDENGIQ